jgi:hypothetical protein
MMNEINASKKRLHWIPIVVVSGAFYFSAPASALAQTAGFSGAWALKERTSLSGQDFANGVPKSITVTEKADVIAIERVLITEAARGENQYVETLAFDGKPFERVTLGKRQAHATIKRLEDPRSLVETISYSLPENFRDHEFTATETWHLSNDNKTLTIIVNYTNEKDPTKNWSMRGVYEKTSTGNAAAGKGVQ